MQRLEKCDECGRLRRTQVFSISRHVAASLKYLPDELVVRESHGNAVQGGASVPTGPSKGMAVATLFELKNERALPLKRSRVKDHLLRHWITAPGFHVRAPRCELCHARKRSERDGDEQYGQNSNRSSTPALFSFTREKWKKEQTDDHHDRANENCESFERRGKQRKYGVEPQEKVIRLRHGLDNRRIRPACRTKWAEVEGASGDCQEHEPREEHIFPHAIGKEGCAIALRQFMVLAFIRRSFHEPARHRPFVDSQRQHPQDMKGHEGDQGSRNHEHMQCEEAR